MNMKRTVTAITITLLTLLAASCGKDKNIDRTAAGADRVTLGASLDNGMSRAGTLVIPDGHKLRYILEVWDTESDANLRHREEKTATTVENVEFTFQLTTTGDYKALLWADFIKDNAGTGEFEYLNPDGTSVQHDQYTDLHYITKPPLTSVELRKTGYKVNDPARDAFCAAVDIKKEVGAYDGAVTLRRPFGQLNLADKNPTLAATVADATLAYSVPQGYNVATGSPSADLLAVNPTVTTPAAGTGLLLTDYIFAPADPAQTTLGEIAITFASNDPAHLLDPFTVPANIPVQRNRRTNVSGAILHQSDAPSDDARLSVTVTDAWDGSATDRDIDLYIPDAAFRTFCITKGYADADGYIIPANAVAVTTLDVSSKGIESLKGLEHFTNLTGLYCYNNKITALDLALYPNLTRLQCDNNKIEVLDVTRCPGLTHLYCYSNLISTLDVTGCAGLMEINCYNNKIEVLDVTRCPELTKLSCNMNRLAALDVTGCTKLNHLACSGNQLKALDLTACPRLTYVGCNDNEITALDMTNCTGITELYCFNNHITTLDITGCTALTNLSCYNNRLTALDASGMSTPWILECGGQRDRLLLIILDLTLRADQQERWEQQASSNNNNRVTPDYKNN